MRRLTCFSAIAAIMALIPACKGPEASSAAIGKYAQSLIQDTTQADYQVISATRNRNIHGGIAVIGEPEATLLLSESLIKSDKFDNINGRTSNDGLPDFAGETICPILDRFNGSYSRFIKNGEEETLSEINVRNYAAALDTACFLNSFDTEKIVHKSSAKLVVLSSPLSSAYGYDDIDTLKTLTNSKVQIVSPVHAMLDAAWKACGPGMNVGIWTTPVMLEGGVYTKVFDKMRDSRKDWDARYTVITPGTDSTVTSRFLEFMKKYADGEGKGKLNALIVDDLSVPVDELREAVKSVMAVDQDRYITYLNFLAPDFKVIDLREAVSSACYNYLRKNNSFTHRITYPQVKLYVTAASERDSSYVTVELKDKYLTEDLRNLMIESTPKVFSEYVR